MLPSDLNLFHTLGIRILFNYRLLRLTENPQLTQNIIGHDDHKLSDEFYYKASEFRVESHLLTSEPYDRIFEAHI